MENENKARITVARPKSDDVGFREIFVSVDGGPNTILEPDDSMTREVEPGHHRVRVHNTLFRKTLELDLQAGGHARFVAVNRAGFGTFGPMAVLGAGLLYLTFRREPDGSS